MAVSSSTVLRVRGLPSNRSIVEVTTLLERSLQIEPESSGLKITSLAEDPYQAGKQVATLMFPAKVPSLFNTSTTKEWSRYIPEASYDSKSGGDVALTFDTHFRGLTALNTPSMTENVIECVAVCGLGGHAFGSFKEKGTSHMWLRDSLPKDLPNLRVLLYGYESGLEGSDSNQNVSVIASSFVGHLCELRPRSKVISRPLIIIAHSLGGLVVKQALINLAQGNEDDKKQMESVVGLLFFGVPNRGMDIESLQAIVGDQHNRYLLESVGQYSDLLFQQDSQFGSMFHFKDTHVVSFFETKSSPTALKVNSTVHVTEECCLPDQVNGIWKMAGPSKILVPRFSATRPRLWDLETYDEGFNRTHSDLVKYSVNDVDYERVRYRLREITSKASATLTSRYLSQESPNIFDADEEACLRSLSFTEIYARESIVEEALQDTGNWLLENRDFQDWRQRRKLQEHRGFFWIQGNPGSGKSTLMKKIYSHVRACEKDASSVVAAFFFNARGSDVEKSPAGLLRTLLHTLCQRISALRSIVARAFIAKDKMLEGGWQWKFSELKEFLALAVESPVLGERSLILFVDALDECDANATRSVIRYFEDLASSSFSERTKLNICLSSRYWPQIRIQHCFVVRVELENEGDIVRYIQEHLESTQSTEDPEGFSLLKTEVLTQAMGTFLWVVLVIRELLNANDAGATLRELRSIVQKVPSDLSDFYQHQLQSTEGKDRDHMLRLLQLVFYAFRPLSPTELRYALAFGCGAFASYAEWSQSGEYVRSDEQMEKRIREHSKGLVEIAQLPGNDKDSQESEDDRVSDDDQDSDDDEDSDSDDDQDKAQSRNTVVQFVHQSVRDFLEADGFSFLRETRPRTHNADGHEFFETACCNYLMIKDFEAHPTISHSLSVGRDRQQSTELKKNHPLLKYMVDYIFQHAAHAEKYGVCQDRFRAYVCSNRGCFERWRCLHDTIVDEPDCYARYYTLGSGARPMRVFAQYGLLTREIAEQERANYGEADPYPYGSALAAACRGGHQDSVKILLDYGADPNLLYVQPWPIEMTALYGAVRCQNLLVLGQVLNHQRSFCSLRYKLAVSVSMRWVEIQSDTWETVLALLFPEAVFPDSAIDNLYAAANICPSRVFSFLLDKFDTVIVHDDKLWCEALTSSNQRESRDKIKALIDRGGRISITGAVVNSLYPTSWRLGASIPWQVRQNRSGGRFFPLEELSFLLEHCDAKITEDLIDTISDFKNSSQIVRTFQAKGYRFGPFTSKQLRCALTSGSAETAAFFLQHHDGNTSAETILEFALLNLYHSEEVTRLLLGLPNPDSINQQAIIVPLDNTHCGPNLTRLLRSNSSFSEFTLYLAVSQRDPDIVRIFLEGLEDVRITKDILTLAVENLWSAKIVELLLRHDPDICIQEVTIIKAIQNMYQGVKFLRACCRHGKPLRCTEKIFEKAAESPIGPKALETILQQDRSANFSSYMITLAMLAQRGAALISLMLDHDHMIDINEEHLVAAASNLYRPRKIFALLQTRGKLDITNAAAEDFNSRPAKRRRVSHSSLPCISTEVLNAAFFNRSESAKRRLLKLFIEWGIITEIDVNNRADVDDKLC